MSSNLTENELRAKYDLNGIPQLWSYKLTMITNSPTSQPFTFITGGIISSANCLDQQVTLSLNTNIFNTNDYFATKMSN